MTLRAVREVRTSDLRVGDAIDWHGERREVVECTDTGRPVLYGNGTSWLVTLIKGDGERVPMQAPTSQKWVVVSANRPCGGGDPKRS